MFDANHRWNNIVGRNFFDEKRLPALILLGSGIGFLNLCLLMTRLGLAYPSLIKCGITESSRALILVVVSRECLLEVGAVYSRDEVLRIYVYLLRGQV